MELHPSVDPRFHRHIHRTYLPDATYFVTTYVRHRREFFLNPDIARIVEETIWHERTSRFIIYAYVVMPDHLHLLLQPTCKTISNIMQSLKSNSCREINRYLQDPHNGECALAVMGIGHDEPIHDNHARFAWQKSFYDHVIKDDKDFRTHVEYIRYNPVKAGLCWKPEDYPFLYIDEKAIGKILTGE